MIEFIIWIRERKEAHRSNKLMGRCRQSTLHIDGSWRTACYNALKLDGRFGKPLREFNACSHGKRSISHLSMYAVAREEDRLCSIRVPPQTAPVA
jgi:hypothetical protein